MHYMETRPDNFYDRDRDRPDTTSFADLERKNIRQRPVRSAFGWIRFWTVAAIAILLVLIASWAIKYYA